MLECWYLANGTVGGGAGVKPLGGGAYLKEVDLWAIGLEIYPLILSDILSLIYPGVS